MATQLMDNPTFHQGELAMQELAGARLRMAEIGPRVIRDHMPDQHRQFFTQLPFLIAGSLDVQGQPWASVLVGTPGFVTSPDPRQLRIDVQPLPHDPLRSGLAVGSPIGLLGIEPHTRRRNRVNGHVAALDANGFRVNVDQSFGNCPKYIQAREAEFVGTSTTVSEPHRMDTLDEKAQALIARSDTFFIATAHPAASRSGASANGVDVSHRGGKPGFVRVDGGSRLTVPDFIGNFFFNTLGNLAVNPRCGLLFIDFERGDLVYVAARGEIVTEGPELASFQGAQRLMRLDVVSGLRIEGVLPLRWTGGEPSPVLAATGNWR